MEFYKLLGFVTVDTDRATPLGWARLHCEGGAMMLLRSEEPVDPSVQSILLYLYTPDLPGLRGHLVANGVEVPDIRFPDYMPSGEVFLSDPDGYAVGVAHWGDQEHEAWLKRIADEPASHSSEPQPT